MPSIFDQLNDSKRVRQEQSTPEVSVRTKHRIHRVAQQLVAKRRAVSALTLIILAAWLWLTYEPVAETTQTIQQTLTLPSATNASNQQLNPIASAPSVLNLQPRIKEATKVSSENNNTPVYKLSEANQKAIELALTGQANQAASILEQALLNDPQAGLIFDNLRRLYAGLASQSYQLAIDPGKPKAISIELAGADRNVAVQLELPKTLSETAKLQPTPVVIAAVVPPSKPAATNTKVVESTAVSEPAPEITSNLIEASIAPTPAPVIKAATPATNEPSLAQKETSQRKAIQQALKNWSDAWSKQDVKGYFASYAPSYAPKNSTRKAWMDYRQERITAPKRIKVELSDIKITLTKPNIAKVSLIQNYSSDTLNSRNSKTLELELVNNAWLITFESGR